MRLSVTGQGAWQWENPFYAVAVWMMCLHWARMDSRFTPARCSCGKTLRIRQQQPAADCLAIPQPNEAGTHIDWYSPFPGKVTSWLAANEAQRAQAVHLLERSLATFNALIAETQTTDHPSQRLFGALLSKAMQIPDPQPCLSGRR
jgi:hypothetical protein